jgi:uncharacterized protein (DUF2141 family)
VRRSNRQRPAFAILAIAILLATGPLAADERVAIDVSIVGIETLEGEIVVAVFDNEASFDRRLDPVAFAYLPVDSAVVRWSAELPAPGTYAIAVYHDRNGNRELDMRRLGGPKEPFGFSNDARGLFRPPSFDDAKISVELERYEVEVAVR